MLKFTRAILVGLLASLVISSLCYADSVLFVGNSFTFGYGSAVRYFHHAWVTDLNNQQTSGVAALFMAFSQERQLHNSATIETFPGVGLDWHVRERLPVLTKTAYDVVFLQSYSTLDEHRPGDPAMLIASSEALANQLHQKNPAVRVFLVSTWSRPDLTFVDGKHWSGKAITQMALDVRKGYDEALAKSKVIEAVIPVGEAFNEAIRDGVAIENPYNPKPPEQIDLWTYDHYHASTAGYYLEALVEWSAVTLIDPQALGAAECAAHELGLSVQQALILQQIASKTLVSQGFATKMPAPTLAPDAVNVERCIE